MKTEQQIREAMAVLGQMLESREAIHSAVGRDPVEKFARAAYDDDYNETVALNDALSWVLDEGIETPDAEDESILARRLRLLKCANQ